MNQIADPEILQFLSLSLAPVVVIGVGVLIIKLTRKPQKDNDKGQD
jgi:hypothetical protein